MVQVRRCGLEQRDSKGQLMPIAVSKPIKLICGNCTIEFIFNIPPKGGHPKVTKFVFVGLPPEKAESFRSEFVSGWAFPGCIENGQEHGFNNERWRFSGKA
ncbi:hypothetical protein [Microbulbifer rhizosphaerae]|uniref:Uncharacterized protein n=1 Tax=Microbulbifer rhizosphaerae TaxID=1562603 RepID=A0A7W4Z9R5_9GAMM|nr:hypothetical protein [Microbulbifer rhizosphaerae]MBB3061856.1 hypothetical protein [Microbulbifer rhizosphaerae]